MPVAGGEKISSKLKVSHTYLKLENSNLVDAEWALKIICCMPVESDFLMRKYDNTMHCKNKKDFTNTTTLNALCTTTFKINIPYCWTTTFSAKKNIRSLSKINEVIF